jgi:ABC-type transport system substrate-binding protein
MGPFPSESIKHANAEQTRKADPSIHIEPFYIGNLLALQINTRKGSLSHPKVRQASSLAIDRDAINSTLYFDQGRRVAWLPGAIGGQFPLTPDQAARLYPYDPDKAKKLLAEAGYKQGFETSIATTAAWSLTAVILDEALEVGSRLIPRIPGGIRHRALTAVEARHYTPLGL